MTTPTRVEGHAKVEWDCPICGMVHEVDYLFLGEEDDECPNCGETVVVDHNPYEHSRYQEGI